MLQCKNDFVELSVFSTSFKQACPAARTESLFSLVLITLKYLINEHARLLNLKKNSTLLALIPSCSLFSFQENINEQKIILIFVKNLSKLKQKNW